MDESPPLARPVPRRPFHLPRVDSDASVHKPDPNTGTTDRATNELGLGLRSGNVDAAIHTRENPQDTVSSETGTGTGTDTDTDTGTDTPSVLEDTLAQLQLKLGPRSPFPSDPRFPPRTRPSAYVPPPPSSSSPFPPSPLSRPDPADEASWMTPESRRQLADILRKSLTHAQTPFPSQSQPQPQSQQSHAQCRTDWEQVESFSLRDDPNPNHLLQSLTQSSLTQSPPHPSIHETNLSAPDASLTTSPSFRSLYASTLSSIFGPMTPTSTYEDHTPIGLAHPDDHDHDHDHDHERDRDPDRDDHDLGTRTTAHPAHQTHDGFRDEMVSRHSRAHSHGYSHTHSLSHSHGHSPIHGGYGHSRRASHGHTLDHTRNPEAIMERRRRSMLQEEGNASALASARTALWSGLPDSSAADGLGRDSAVRDSAVREDSPDATDTSIKSHDHRSRDTLANPNPAPPHAHVHPTSQTSMRRTPRPRGRWARPIRWSVLFLLGAGFGRLLRHLALERVGTDTCTGTGTCTDTNGSSEYWGPWAGPIVWGMGSLWVGLLFPWLDSLWAEVSATDGRTMDERCLSRTRATSEKTRLSRGVSDGGRPGAASPRLSTDATRVRPGDDRSDDGRVNEPEVYGSWTLAMRSVMLLMGLVLAIRRFTGDVPSDGPSSVSSSGVQAVVCLAVLVNALVWYGVDRSAVGLAVGGVTSVLGSTALWAVCGPDVVRRVVPWSHSTWPWSSPPFSSVSPALASGPSGPRSSARSDVGSVVVWTGSLLFCCVLCFGHVGRRLSRW